MSTHKPTYAVYWPRGERTLDVKPVAPRLDNLEDKTVAFLWDYLFRGDEIFETLKRELAPRYPGIKFVDYETFGSTHGGEEHEVLAALPDKLKTLGVSAVVSGMGC